MMLTENLRKIRNFLVYPLYNLSDFSSLRAFNNLVALMHFIQFIVVVSLNETKYKHIPPDQIFVSSTINLATPYSMIHVYTDPTPSTKCTGALDVINSDWYRSRPHLNNGELTIKGVGDSMILDLRGTTNVEWSAKSASLDVTVMIMCFFLLSWGFQILNGWYIQAYPDGPRYLQYVEYSLSASLTIVVMALNTGIQDLYTILTIFALFFGMNVFGILSEFMIHLAEMWDEAIDFKVLRLPFRYLWLIPHACGWVLFLFAWLPIIIKYFKVKACSKNSAGVEGVPYFVAIVVACESVFYFLFGILQLVVLLYRTWRPADKKEWKNRLDVYTVLLSLLAKTLLAWMLLGPRLKAKIP